VSDRVTGQPHRTILHTILEEVENSKLKVLTVFDLDSTLFDLTLRISRIVDAFALDPQHRVKFPRECAGLANVKILPTDWGLGEPLSRAGLPSSHSSAFFQALHGFWSECFFSNGYLHHDEPLPGAVEYVKRIRKSGGEIMYLTGRDTERMLEGTELSLRQQGFPLEKGAELVLKPRAEMDDAWFKVDILKELAPRFDQIWLFENEPVNLNLCAKECPRVGLVFIETTHSGREQITVPVHRIRDFNI
jgi:hypothetical protein